MGSRLLPYCFPGKHFAPRTADDKPMDSVAGAETLTILHPLLQYGFAGFALLQFSVGVWLFLRALQVLTDLQSVNAQNTSAIATLDATARHQQQLLAQIKDHLLARPCLLSHDVVDMLVRRIPPVVVEPPA